MKREIRESAPAKYDLAGDYIAFLKGQLAQAREDILHYRAKSERLELALAAGKTGADYVERTDAQSSPVSWPRPTIVNEEPPPRKDMRPDVIQTPFRRLEKQWNEMTSAQQAEATGEPTPEPKVTVV